MMAWVSYFEGKAEKPDRNFTYLTLDTDTHRTKMICEIFSPRRVTPFSTRLGFKPGWCMDINHQCPETGQSWDLRCPRTQRKVKEMVRKGQPYVLILSPFWCFQCRSSRLG